MENITIPIGISKEIEFIVTKEQTAVHIGSGSISVLSTPSMILYMEIASGKLAHENIPQGYTSVGTVVNIQHIAAVFEGNRVVANSTVLEVDKRKITFEVEVLHGDRLIGKGIHVRYIVNEAKFLEKLKSTENSK